MDEDELPAIDSDNVVASESTRRENLFWWLALATVAIGTTEMVRLVNALLT